MGVRSVTVLIWLGATFVPLAGKVDVEVNVGMYHTGGRRRCEFGKGNSRKEKVWTGCNYPCFLIPWVVRSD